MCPKHNYWMNLAGDDGKSLCNILGLSEGSSSSSGGQACLDNVETQMTDEQMMDGIAEKHRASTGSLDLASSPEPEQKLLDNDADKKPSNLPVVVHPNSKFKNTGVCWAL